MPHFLSPRLGLTLCVLALGVMSAGCINIMNLDTSYARAQGETGFTVGVGGNTTEEVLIRVEGNDKITEQSFPAAGFQEDRFQVSARFELGLGAGFEVQVSHDAPFVFDGFGGGLGLKWQIPFGDISQRTSYEWPIGVALSGRVNGSFGGHGHVNYTTSVQGRVLLSATLVEGVIVTIAPVIMNTWVWFDRESLMGPSTINGDVWSTGGSIGLMADFGARYHIELTTLYTPSQDESSPERWMFIPAIGVGL